MRVALAVTTYERADALARVLESVAAQARPPDELLVADDGSGADTRAIVAAHASRAPYPVRHLWQAHEGFRVARVRNLAIAAARADYLVLADGDMLLHPQFLADHERHARPRSFVQGVRIPLDASATQDILQAAPRSAVALARKASAGISRRRAWARHSPPLSRGLSILGNALVAVKSCNQGHWRSELIAVNGFNEAMTGWGPEDKELAIRLERHGVRRRTLLFGGIAWHLDHPPASRDRRAINEGVLAETRNSYTVRCVHGLDRHPT